MRPLSATEAISPAIERTKDLLVRPFRVRTFLKLAAVAFFAEIGGFSLNSPSRMGSLPHTPPAIQASMLAFALLFGLVFFLVGLILVYVGSRLQLVLVELVATRNTHIAPLWRRFGRTTWRWLGLRMLFVLVSLIVFLAVAGPFLLRLVRHPPAPGATLPPAFFAHALGLVAILLPVFLILVVFYILLRDLALPPIVLEDLSLAQALDRMRALIAAEPGQVALYVLLRTLLGLVMVIAAEIAMALVVVVSLIPCALLGAGLWFATRNAGAIGNAILLASAGVATLLLLLWIAGLLIAATGPVFLFLQSYALFFLGGRYPLLGNTLEASSPGFSPPAPPPLSIHPLSPSAPFEP